MQNLKVISTITRRASGVVCICTCAFWLKAAATVDTSSETTAMRSALRCCISLFVIRLRSKARLVAVAIIVALLFWGAAKFRRQTRAPVSKPWVQPVLSSCA